MTPTPIFLDCFSLSVCVKLRFKQRLRGYADEFCASYAERSRRVFCNTKGCIFPLIRRSIMSSAPQVRCSNTSALRYHYLTDVRKGGNSDQNVGRRSLHRALSPFVHFLR